MRPLTHDVTGLLSLWRSPIDKVAVAAAESLQNRQPVCTIVYNEDFTQITMYNYAQYIAAASGNADTALDDMFQAMGASSSYYGNIGGLAYIPQQQVSVEAPDPNVRLHQVPDQINMLGSGTGGYNGTVGTTNFHHFVITPIATTPGDFSQFLTCSGNHTDGGKYFRSVAFQWLKAGATSTDICISADGWNIHAVNCTFHDCPTAFYALGLACGLEQCTIYYSAGAPNDAVAVYLIGPESFVKGPCEIDQDPIESKGGPTGCTAVSLGGKSPSGNLEHAVLAYLHLSDWSYAINYGFLHGVNYSHVTNVEAESFITCVMMQPPFTGENNQIYGEKYTSCTFAKSGDSVSSSAIVFVDTNGQSNDAINDIEFVNCTVFSQATGLPLDSLFGYQITSGSNIRIIGGTVSGVGPGTFTAGIAITPTLASGGPAGPGRITILGVDLNPSYPQSNGGGAQLYALIISANLQDVVTVDNCRMNGYGTAGPIHITGTVTNNLFIRSCQGYNDRSTVIASGVMTGDYPTSVTGNTAATAGALAGGVNYYGPSLVIFTVGAAALTVHINGVASTYQQMAVGTVFLNSPYDVFYFGAAPSHFQWIGK